MKKKLCLFLVNAALLTTGLVANKSEAHENDFKEYASDIYSVENHVKKIRKTDSVTNSAVVSPMFAQYGKDGADSYLRFATAIKGDVTSIKFIRKVEGKEDKVSECTTLYKSISALGKNYYYDGTNLVEGTSDNNEFYWACYTIKFAENSSYLDKNITLDMYVDEATEQIATKETSYKFLSQIGVVSGIKVTKELTSSFLVGQAITFDELEVSTIDGNGNFVAVVPNNELEFYESGTKLDLNTVGYTDAGNYTITAKYKDYTANFNMNIANNIYDLEAEYIFLNGEKPAQKNVNYVERIRCNTDTKELNPIIYGDKPEGGTDYATYNKADAKNASGQAYLGEVKASNEFDLHFYSGVEKNVTLYMTASSGVIEKDVESWKPVKMADIQLNEMIEISQNGKKFTIGDDVVLPGSETLDANGNIVTNVKDFDPLIWANFKRVAIGQINLVQGDNVIRVKITKSMKNEETITKSNGTMNIDKFDLVDDIGYLVEAEEIMNSDEVVPTNRNYLERVKYSGNQLGAMLSANGKKEAEKASGQGYLGEIKGNNAFNVHVWSEVERDVNVIMKASSGVIAEDVANWKPVKMSDIQLNQMISVEANGKAFTIAEDVILPGSEAIDKNDDGVIDASDYDELIWVNFKDVTLGVMHLNKGDNVIRINIKNAIAFTGNHTKSSGTLNIDYFEFNYTK